MNILSFCEIIDQSLLHHEILIYSDHVYSHKPTINTDARNGKSNLVMQYIHFTEKYLYIYINNPALMHIL